MANKDAQLERQKEERQTRDLELDRLAQQLKQLQAAAEAKVEARVGQDEQGRRERAVNVSLDQGMGTAEAGQMPMLPSSLTALRARVQTLEVSCSEKNAMADSSHACLLQLYAVYLPVH